MLAAGEALARRARKLRDAGQAVRFYFVFAGHGDVEDGQGFVELPDGRLGADDLLALVRAVGAAEAHVILDSCNSFFVVNPRKAGGRRVTTPQDAAEALARRLPDVGVFLSTSSQAEVYEWSELQSGVFSHAVRSGLLGGADTDGDGRVTYEELAGFVETASAEIRNPLYRPRVFARGPNGEGGRAIVVRPAAARARLEVDEADPVRLAIRDEDGLRWADVHKEAGARLELWYPPARAGAIEIERLAPGAAGMERVSVHRLPAEPGPVRLATVEGRAAGVAERGTGEIFRSLFALPFGPAALGRFVEGGGMARVGECPAEPEEANPWRPQAALHLGFARPRLPVTASGNPDPAMGLGLDVAGEVVLPVGTAAGVMLGVGWLGARSGPTWRSRAFWDGVLGPGWLGPREPPSAAIRASVVPVLAGITVGWRLAGPVHARVHASAGAARVWLEVAPAEAFTAAVQRGAGWVPAVEVGGALELPLARGLTAGFRADYLAGVAGVPGLPVEVGLRALRVSTVMAWSPRGGAP
ncbi:MAG: hypothetical protein U0229_10280 [Anaeromyxobacter sp.]